MRAPARNAYLAIQPFVHGDPEIGYGWGCVGEGLEQLLRELVRDSGKEQRELVLIAWARATELRGILDQIDAMGREQSGSPKS